jgi:hypothetical protein
MNWDDATTAQEPDGRQLLALLRASGRATARPREMIAILSERVERNTGKKWEHDAFIAAALRHGIKRLVIDPGRTRQTSIGDSAALTLASKGTAAALNSRATWTADHLPPRGAGMPRSSSPTAKAQATSVEGHRHFRCTVCEVLQFRSHS